MAAIRGTIPEHIRRLMPDQQRRELGKAAMTIPEIEAKNAAKLERELQEGIAGYLRLKQVVFGQSRMDRRSSYTVGWPDFAFVVNGRACFLEVKRPGEKPTKEQQEIMAGLEQAGAFVRVVHSVAAAIEAYKEVSEAPYE
jgi:hypothetical protein